MRSCPGLLKEPCFYLKAIAAGLLIVASVLRSDFLLDYTSDGLFAVSAFGYILILAVLLLVFVLDQNEPLTDLIFLIVGAVIDIVTGVLILVSYSNSYEKRASCMISAILVVSAGVVMAVDAFFSGRN